MDRLMKLVEAAKVIGVDLRTFYRLIARGDLPQPVKVGARSSRIHQSDIERYMQRLKAERR